MNKQQKNKTNIEQLFKWFVDIGVYNKLMQKELEEKILFEQCKDYEENMFKRECAKVTKNLGKAIFKLNGSSFPQFLNIDDKEQQFRVRIHKKQKQKKEM